LEPSTSGCRFVTPSLGVRTCIGFAVPGRPIGPWSRNPPVHGGYTRSRQVEERNGRERSPRELRNRRSARQRSRHQVCLQEAGQSSSLPTRLPRALRPLTHETVVTEDGPPPPAEPGAVTNRWSHRRSHPAVPPMCNAEHGPSHLPRPCVRSTRRRSSRLIGTFGATVVSDATTSPVGGR
jgi:hypothetical protein